MSGTFINGQDNSRPGVHFRTINAGINRGIGSTGGAGGGSIGDDVAGTWTLQVIIADATSEIKVVPKTAQMMAGYWKLYYNYEPITDLFTATTAIRTASVLFKDLGNVKAKFYADAGGTQLIATCNFRGNITAGAGTGQIVYEY